jgi:hypothetical protein
VIAPRGVAKDQPPWRPMDKKRRSSARFVGAPKRGGGLSYFGRRVGSPPVPAVSCSMVQKRKVPWLRAAQSDCDLGSQRMRPS